MSPTDEAQPSLLPQTNSSDLSVSTAAAAAVTDFMKHHVWELLSRKQPILDPDTKFYLSVLLCIAAANSVFTFVRAFSFAYGGLVAARKLHEQLLTSVIIAPAKFFQTTVPGKRKHKPDCQCCLFHAISYACAEQLTRLNVQCCMMMRIGVCMMLDF